MSVLKNEREFGLATVTAASFLRHCATRWIKKEGAIVGFAIVIARYTETKWPRQNQQRGRKGPVVVMHVDQWRIKRGKVRSPLKISSLKSPIGCVNAEAAKRRDHGDYLKPTGLTSRSV